MRLLLFFGFALLFIPALAQESSQIKTSATPTFFQGPWKVQTFLDYPHYQFLLSTGDGRSSLKASDKRLQFSPSNNPEVAFVISKGLFRLGYRTSVPFIDNPTYRDYDRGTTDVTNLEFGFNWKFLEVGTYYSRFRGYYVDLNATSGLTVVEDEEGTTITTGTHTDGVPDIWNRPDIETYNYGFFTNAHLPVTGKDSLFSQFDPGNAFEGLWDMGFLLGLGYHRLAIEGDSPFVPQARAATFPDIAQLTGIYQHALYAQFGMTNLFHLGPKWFIQTNLTIGAESLTHYQRNDATEDRHDVTTGSRFDVVLGFGYEGENHRFGIHHKSSFRMMNKLAATNLDSQFSHTGIEYTLTF